MKVAVLIFVGCILLSFLIWPPAGSKAIKGNRASVDSAED